MFGTFLLVAQTITVEGVAMSPGSSWGTVLFALSIPVLAAALIHFGRRPPEDR